MQTTRTTLAVSFAWNYVSSTMGFCQLLSYIKKIRAGLKKWNPYLSIFHFDLIYFCSIVLIHILFKKINITFLLFNQLFNHIPKIEATIETIRVKGCMADFDSGISGPPRLSSSRFIGSI